MEQARQEKQALVTVGGGEKPAYGLGALGMNLIFNTMSTYLMTFYTDVFGVTASAVGTLFLVARVWDAVVERDRRGELPEQRKRHLLDRPRLQRHHADRALPGLSSGVRADRGVGGRPPGSGALSPSIRSSCRKVAVQSAWHEREPSGQIATVDHSDVHGSSGRARLRGRDPSGAASE